MAVFRVERNRGYTVMSNHHLRNKELSLKAKGLLSHLSPSTTATTGPLPGISFPSAAPQTGGLWAWQSWGGLSAAIWTTA